MNNWMKIGLASLTLAGTVGISAEVLPDEYQQPENLLEFKIEASDLIAKKLRDRMAPFERKQDLHTDENQLS